MSEREQDREARELLARAADDPAVREHLASHDDYLGALKLAGELWMMACMLVGMYVFYVLDSGSPGETGALVGLVLLLPIGLCAAAPGMWLSVTINRMLKAPERSMLVRVTQREGERRVRRLEIVTAEGTTEWVVPRFKAFLEGTGGGMAQGSVAVAVLRGDQLVDWFAYAGRARP